MESEWRMMEYGYDRGDVIGVNNMVSFGICDEEGKWIEFWGGIDYNRVWSEE